MDLTQVVYGGVDWIQMVQYRLIGGVFGIRQ
jgi:hypothetical protein